MPIPTDEPLWQDAEPRTSVRTRVMAFLTEHDDRAFNAFEIADEVMGTYWGRYHELELARLEEGEEAIDMEAYEEVMEESTTDSVLLDAVRDALDHLLYEDRLVSHLVPIRETNVVAEADDIPYFTTA